MWDVADEDLLKSVLGLTTRKKHKKCYHSVRARGQIGLFNWNRVKNNLKGYQGYITAQEPISLQQKRLLKYVKDRKTELANDFGINGYFDLGKQTNH